MLTSRSSTLPWQPTAFPPFGEMFASDSAGLCRGDQVGLKSTGRRTTSAIRRCGVSRAASPAPCRWSACWRVSHRSAMARRPPGLRTRIASFQSCAPSVVARNVVDGKVTDDGVKAGCRRTVVRSCRRCAVRCGRRRTPVPRWPGWPTASCRSGRPARGRRRRHARAAVAWPSASSTAPRPQPMSSTVSSPLRWRSSRMRFQTSNLPVFVA